MDAGNRATHLSMDGHIRAMQEHIAEETKPRITRPQSSCLAQNTSRRTKIKCKRSTDPILIG